jgi:hypothetical protein
MRSPFRICAAAFGLILATATASLGNDMQPAWNSASAPEFTSDPSEAIPKACCKICSNGKACGNSCIAKNKDCHQPPGCACDG